MTVSREPSIVWDMGGVLYRYFTEVLLDRAAREGWDVDGVPLGPTGGVADDDYTRMARGEIQEPAYVDSVRERLAAVGVDVDPVAETDWDGEFREIVWVAIRRLHEAGHLQAVLTNDAADWLGAGWWETWGPAPWFDAVIDVSTLPGRKPEPGPYQAAAGALGVSPGACLFVDDLGVNCRGAEAAGMSAQWFDVTDPAGSTSTVLKRVGLSGSLSRART